MATIKEMAEDYSFIGEGTDAKGEFYKDYNSDKNEGFVAGANAVIKEIKPLIKLLRGDVRTLFEEKIKELKCK